ncbi:MAG: response regulator transcription factor [Proteobacteria bacterium]|nr:response regulator transcription factor [Pseudomonadota bacterium]
MTDRIEIDESHWPLIVARFPGQTVGTEAFTAYLDALSEILARGETYAMLTDTTALKETITAQQRALVSEWIEQQSEVISRQSVGTALVVRSSVIRGVLLSINWIRPPSNPQKVFTSYPDAVDWVLGQLVERGAMSSPVSARTRRDLLSARRESSELVEEPDERPLPSPGPLGPAIDMFEEPAFLVARGGAMVYANGAARKTYDGAPAWLPAAVANSESVVTQLCRVQRVEGVGGSLYLVVPFAELQPAVPADPRASIELPPSLDSIARLLAQGLTDKEIAQRSERSLATVRTYVTRIYRKVGVNSRGEFIRLWSAKLAR